MPKLTKNTLGKICASALQRHRRQLAYNLLESIKMTERGVSRIAEARHDVETFLETNVYVFIDYLSKYLQTDDDTYKHLYIGEKLKRLYSPNLSVEQSTELKNAVTTKDKEILSHFLSDKMPPAALEFLTTQLDQIHRIIVGKAKNNSNILFIGDCLYLDVMSFLSSAVLAAGISLNPTFATSKNPLELKETLGAMAGNQFDLVFFSPFTYEFSIEYARFLNWHHSPMNQREIQRICENVIQQTASVIDAMADLFDGPIIIHNSINLIREDSPLKRRIKNLLTSNVRHQAKTRINDWLAQYLHDKNTSTFQHLFVLDETKYLKNWSEQQLGAYYYHSNLQHPAVFGKIIADHYSKIIQTRCSLWQKKLVICDLDNTLWEGVIGEGPVHHYHDRQHLLRTLKDKGVVLAINSKNDPANVKWEGGILNEGDFVYANINWEPKVKGMSKIKEALNLKPGDYVFIDDRADEREMVSMVFPEIYCMDATLPRTWELLQLWSEFLEPQTETDRTQLYKEREERKHFLLSVTESHLEQNELFQSLNLTLNIRQAKKSDLKRVDELINRTNQFNLCGSRTSYQEVQNWHDSPNFGILVGEVSDRFGTMGIISVVVLKFTAEQIEIPIYVLSCRVFGYGIEKAMLNHIKRLALKTDLTPGKKIIGFYRETTQNQPGKGLYKDNGFKEENEFWSYEHKEGPVIANPSWLTITVE